MQSLGKPAPPSTDYHSNAAAAATFNMCLVHVFTQWMCSILVNAHTFIMLNLFLSVVGIQIVINRPTDPMQIHQPVIDNSNYGHAASQQCEFSLRSHRSTLCSSGGKCIQIKKSLMFTFSVHAKWKKIIANWRVAFQYWRTNQIVGLFDLLLGNILAYFPNTCFPHQTWDNPNVKWYLFIRDIWTPVSLPCNDTSLVGGSFEFFFSGIPRICQ